MSDETLLRAGARLLLEKAKYDTATFCRVYRPSVLHPARGLILYSPFPKQQALLADLDAGKSALVFKSRQTGITTSAMVQRLRACLEPGTTHVVVSKNQDEARKLIRRARRAMETCDPSFPLKVKEGRDNTLELGFENESSIIGLAPTEEGGRAEAATTVLLDEVRSLPWPDALWQSLGPALTHGASVCMVSTPDIEGSFYHQHWTTTSSGQTPWAYHVVHWRDWPGRDEEWAEQKRAELQFTQQMWDQEYELKWGSLADALFSAEGIELALRLGTVAWMPPVPVHAGMFAAGGDLSGGGRAETVLLALDIRQKPFRVCEVRHSPSWTAPRQADEIVKFAQDFAVVPWLDRTGVGWGIAGNVSVPKVGVAFTGGREVTGTAAEPNIPRERLMQHLAWGMEQGHVAIPAEQQDLVIGLRASTLKGKGVNSDHVDALALAYWGATGGDRRPINLADLIGRPSTEEYRPTPPSGLDAVMA